MDKVVSIHLKVKDTKYIETHIPKWDKLTESELKEVGQWLISEFKDTEILYDLNILCCINNSGNFNYTVYTFKCHGLVISTGKLNIDLYKIDGNWKWHAYNQYADVCKCFNEKRLFNKFTLLRNRYKKDHSKLDTIQSTSQKIADGVTKKCEDMEKQNNMTITKKSDNQANVVPSTTKKSDDKANVVLVVSNNK